jgi:hypothetical protein
MVDFFAYILFLPYLADSEGIQGLKISFAL